MADQKNQRGENRGREGARDRDGEEEGGRLVAVKARKGKEQKSNGDFGESGGC